MVMVLPDVYVVKYGTVDSSGMLQFVRYESFGNRIRDG
jgi:hypothetical protein